MSQHPQPPKIGGLNPNLVAFIFVTTFVVLGILIFSRDEISQSKSDDSEAVALAAPTATPSASATVVPPTQTSSPSPTHTALPSATPTDLPVSTATPVVTEVTSQNPQTHTASDYDPALIAQGETLFPQCAACHGADGRGVPGLGKDLVTSEFVHSLTDEELLTFIKTGRPIWDPMNTTGIDMPPKGGNPALTDEDIMAIIAYIHSLTATND